MSEAPDDPLTEEQLAAIQRFIDATARLAETAEKLSGLGSISHTRSIAE